MVPKKVLVVDDDHTFCLTIETYLQNMGFEVFIINSGIEAADYLNGKNTPLSVKNPPHRLDVILLDMNIPDLSGPDILEETREYREDLPVIVVTSEEDRDRAIDAMKLGASDYIIKGQKDQLTRLLTSINTVEEKRNLKHQVSELKKDDYDTLSFSNIIGNSKAILGAISLAQRIADSDAPVFIGGESGVGKEILAKAIHGSSIRRSKKFVAVNCGAIPENLAESILFGHEKGSFTGAVTRSIGKFREADRGTLFLDEVGELSPAMQVKLLRALQEREIEPVGSRETIKIDIRIISATNRNLLDEVEKGRFREDLYYRINVFPIYVPPLRERFGDIPLLAEEFCRHFAMQERKDIDGIRKKTMEALVKYHWPGNVRQMKNAIFRAVILSESDELEITDFSHIITDSKPTNNCEVRIRDYAGRFRNLSDIREEIIACAIKHFSTLR